MGIKRNTAYNLLGMLVPMAVSVVTVPIFLRLIGDARYGVLALVWLFLGYFGLFDPGITRAALFHIARLGREQNIEREDVFWTALTINLCFGLIGGLVVYFAARPLFMSAFKMPDNLRAEVIASLPWLASSVPLSIATGVLGGAMQARESFASFNFINACNALATQTVPLAVAYWHGPNLKWLIAAVLITRTVGSIPMFVVLKRALPFGVGGAFQTHLVRTLFSYGGWVTISNLIMPILTTMDRVVIGNVIGAQGVAFYTVPFNLVSRISLLPASFATSLFPKLSRGSQGDSARLADEAIMALAAVMTPLIVFTMAILPVFMRFWVGASFAQRAAPVGVVLLAGVWINGLAIIPFEHLQATNRPDLTAKFHAIEAVPFLAALWVGVHYFGLIGAACAWSFRVTFEALLLLMVARQVKEWRRLVVGGVIVLVTVGLSSSQIFSWRSLAEVLVIAVALVWSWRTSPHVQHAVKAQLLRSLSYMSEIVRWRLVARTFCKRWCNRNSLL
jgi:O-antigen/teichoic acid export membrane protein